MTKPPKSIPRTPDEVAARVLEEFEISGPPVPIDQLARGMGIQLVYEPFDGDVSGILHRGQNGEATMIVVNTYNATVRQRFTMAHELGHFLMHNDVLFVDKPVSVRFRDSLSSLAISNEEIQANRFAACALMPESWVIDEANHELAREPEIASEELVERLARRFDVSRQAMEIRLAGLGVWGPL